MIFLCAIDLLESEEQRLTAERIFEVCRNMMYHTAYGVLRNREDAEDAVADSLVKICRNLDKFEGREEHDWKLLVQILVKNTAIDHYRKRRREAADSLDSLEWEVSEDLLTEEEDFGGLQKYVERLSEQHRTILILKYAENMKNKEIAEFLGILPATASTRILRAKKHLLELYRKDGGIYEK